MVSEQANEQREYKEHKVYLSEREHAEFSGIEYVESYDPSGVVCYSSYGGISVEGENLKIENFSVDSGKLIISGTVDGLYYFSKSKETKSGFFGKKTK